MLKRITALLLVAMFTFTLAACGGDKDATSSTVGNVSDVSDVASADAASQDAASADTKSTDSKQQAAANNSKTQGSQAAANNSKTQAANASRVTQNSSKRPTVSAAGQGNLSGKTNITSVAGWINVKSGKSQTEGLNLKGKTIKMAITEEGQYHTASFKRTIAAFEKQYNCKIKIDELKFEEYNRQVSDAIKAGKPYDICYIHGYMFPTCAIDELYEDMLPVLRKSDLVDMNDVESGGIDLNKSSYFSYHGKLYGTCNFQSVFPYVIYYSKKQMADVGYSGSKDPRTLEEKGKWTLSVITSMGKKLTDSSSGIYFLGGSFSGRGTYLAYGAPYLSATTNNSKKTVTYKSNVTSKEFIAGAKQVQQWFCGNNKIGSVDNNSGTAENGRNALIKGQIYLMPEESSKYLDFNGLCEKSSNFGYSKKNLGVVAQPLGSTNTKKKYPTGWLTAVAASRGTDARVALAWDVFRSGYVDPVTDPAAMSAEDKAYCLNLLKGDICCELGDMSDNSNYTRHIVSDAVVKISKGSDISKTLSAINGQVNNCIKVATSK